MSGPIVRTGTTPKFWANWDKAFGAETDGNKPAAKGATAKKAKKKSVKKKSKK